MKNKKIGIRTAEQKVDNAVMWLAELSNILNVVNLNQVKRQIIHRSEWTELDTTVSEFAFQ